MMAVISVIMIIAMTKIVTTMVVTITTMALLIESECTRGRQSEQDDEDCATFILC